VLEIDCVFACACALARMPFLTCNCNCTYICIRRRQFIQPITFEINIAMARISNSHVHAHAYAYDHIRIRIRDPRVRAHIYTCFFGAACSADCKRVHGDANASCEQANKRAIKPVCPISRSNATEPAPKHSKVAQRQPELTSKESAHCSDSWS
jgi:hypothetical protein